MNFNFNFNKKIVPSLRRPVNKMKIRLKFVQSIGFTVRYDGPMTKLTLATVVLFSACHLFAFNTDDAAQELLHTAKSQANLFANSAKPFQMDVDFVAQINAPLQGHLTLKWESEDHWWRKIVMGEFVQVDVRDGEKQYTTRNASFTPAKIDELIHMLEFPKRPEAPAKKVKSKVENGIEIDCLRSEGKNIETREICVNPASHEILRDESTLSEDEKRIERYSDYSDFQTYRYPRKFELLSNSRKIITATVTGLTLSAFDQALLVPPQRSIERRYCKDMTAPVRIKGKIPEYPSSVNQTRIDTDNTVIFTIETDGSVSNVHLLRSSTQAMDNAMVETVKTWRYKPAMCGAEPVVSDVTVFLSRRVQ